MPNFYANGYPTRPLLKSKPSATATASATVAEVFLSTATASATAEKTTFGRPLFLGLLGVLLGSLGLPGVLWGLGFYGVLGSFRFLGVACKVPMHFWVVSLAGSVGLNGYSVLFPHAQCS